MQINVIHENAPFLLSRERLERALRGKLLEAGELVARAARRKASGEVLRMRSGRLAQSITAFAEDSLLVRVETDVPYAIFHEFGASPFLRPSLEENREKIAALLSSAFQGETS